MSWPRKIKKKKKKETVKQRKVSKEKLKLFLMERGSCSVDGGVVRTQCVGIKGGEVVKSFIVVGLK